MTNPVPGFAISTPYGRRGSYWSCDEDSNGNGIHTGSDYAALAGTWVVAARPGTVVHSAHGSAFGSHQVDVIAGDGTRDFYAHMRSRAPAGTWLEAGDKVGEVGSEGNVTGPHLHFERHATEWGGWSCSVVRDPAPSHNYPLADTPESKPDTPEEPMPTYLRARLTTPVKAKAGDWISLTWDKVPNGSEVITPGEAAVRIAGKMTTLALTVTVETSGLIRTRFLERSKAGDDWQTDETWPNLEHTATAGSTYLASTPGRRRSGTTGGWSVRST